ncbi:MAG TPA: protease pro-enzyme activation domain-containing protein, partial [Acidimicrobiales bacterium]
MTAAGPGGSLARTLRRSAAFSLAGAVVWSSGVVMAPAVSAAAPPPSGVSAVTGGPGRLPVGTRAMGPLRSDDAISVDVALRPADPAALAAFVQAVTTPGSPQFRHFLAPGQFASRFGPAPSAVAATRAWLRSRGLVVGATARDGLLIPVSGPASVLGGAFGVGFALERLPSGRIVREPTQRPAVPSGLAATVQGVVGLDDLAQSVPQLARPSPGALPPRARTSGPVPHAGPSACGSAQAVGTTATDLAQAYSMTSLYPGNEGQSVTVGIYELEPYSPADISTFESCYSPAPNPTISPVSVDGAAPNSGPGSGESALDIEMVVGLVPAAAIDVYVGPNFGTGPLDVFSRMVSDDSAQVLSTSWGQCEPAAGPAEITAESDLLQVAAVQGQTFTAAAGDEGSEDCNAPGFFSNTNLEVDDPASQPWVTSVGGTELGALGPPPGESVWNTGIFEGTTGGGISTAWT